MKTFDGGGIGFSLYTHPRKNIKWRRSGEEKNKQIGIVIKREKKTDKKEGWKKEEKRCRITAVKRHRNDRLETLWEDANRHRQKNKAAKVLAALFPAPASPLLRASGHRPKPRKPSQALRHPSPKASLLVFQYKKNERKKGRKKKQLFDVQQENRTHSIGTLLRRSAGFDRIRRQSN